MRTLPRTMDVYLVSLLPPIVPKVSHSIYFCNFQGMRSVAANAVARLSQFDPDQLPPSIRGVIMVVNKAAQLFSDIKTDVMEFYQVS